ncbi:hypothetical protein IB267_02940 [Ensifer sp. ENS09]|uniref:hypothetical protein n=1 Tax=Ensifer sp. ENS09 TaxID=2769263 RepID=UPI00177F2FE6|nr:hypothetical protein [Ensifer sp. ENS09]MBD9647304.1 hypothetical protein [Ensifer sp. ENS09]
MFRSDDDPVDAAQSVILLNKMETMPEWARAGAALPLGQFDGTQPVVPSASYREELADVVVAQQLVAAGLIVVTLGDP